MPRDQRLLAGMISGGGIAAVVSAGGMAFAPEMAVAFNVRGRRETKPNKRDDLVFLSVACSRFVESSFFCFPFSDSCSLPSGFGESSIGAGSAGRPSGGGAEKIGDPSAESVADLLPVIPASRSLNH